MQAYTGERRTRVEELGAEDGHAQPHHARARSQSEDVAFGRKGQGVEEGSGREGYEASLGDPGFEGEAFKVARRFEGVWQSEKSR